MADELNRHQNYQVKCVLGLSITLIILGSICIVVQVVDIIIESDTSIPGTGIWGGIFIIIAGALGVASIKRKTSLIVAFLVMSIIAAVLAVGPITAGAFGTTGAFGLFVPYDVSDTERAASIAMNSIMVFAAAVSAILLILGSAFACHGLCPKRKGRHVVVYTGTAEAPASTTLMPEKQ